MHVVFAPDKFAGTLSALEAASAMATGWARRAPEDELVQVPMSDGGPGFVDVLHVALGGELHAVTVPDPYGVPVPATILQVGDTAYIESAQAVGLHLTEPKDRDPERGTTTGLGELLAQAAASGASRVVLGLGGSAHQRRRRRPAGGARRHVGGWPARRWGGGAGHGDLRLARRAAGQVPRRGAGACE